MAACDRCFRPVDQGEHGPYICLNRAAIARDRAERAAVEAQLAPWVRGDEIPGGLVIEHGLCNEDGSPRTYYSQSEIDRECLRRGLVRWTDIYTEDKTKDARVRAEWLQSSEAKRQKQDRDEMRRAGIRPQVQRTGSPPVNHARREAIARIAREVLG